MAQQATVLTRAELVDAIEAGIANAELTGADADKLREVGRTARFVARGTYKTPEGIGCPLVQSDLDGYLLSGAQQEAFMCAYDGATRAYGQARRWFPGNLIEVRG